MYFEKHIPYIVTCCTEISDTLNSQLFVVMKDGKVVWIFKKMDNEIVCEYPQSFLCSTLKFTLLLLVLH